MSKKTVEAVDTMFEYGPEDVEEAKKFITSIEGTEAFWHLIARLTVSNTELLSEIRSLKDKVQELETVNENMGNAFRRKNEYGY